MSWNYVGFREPAVGLRHEQSKPPKGLRREQSKPAIGLGHEQGEPIVWLTVAIGPVCVLGATGLSLLLARGSLAVGLGAALMAVLGLMVPRYVDGLPHLAHLPLMTRTAGMLIAAPAVALVTYWVNRYVGAAGWVTVSCFLGAVALGVVGARLQKRGRRKVVRPIRVAVVGAKHYASGLGEELVFAPTAEIELAGRLDVVAAGTESLLSIVKRERIDLLLIARSGPEAQLFEEIERTWGDLPVAVEDLSTFYEQHLGRVPLAAIDAGWLQALLRPPNRAAEAIRRLVDIAVSGAVLAMLAPLLAFLIVMIRRDGGPAIYRQERLGKGGRSFEILKLRSMRVGSGDGAVWSSAEDRRVTTLGRYLRATHLDEAPQLVNILRGDMSLVGPRPEQSPIAARLGSEIRYYDWRHRVRPGLTGWAQVLAGYCGTERGSSVKACYDLYYLKYRSLFLDLVILCETFRTLVADRQWSLPDFDETFIPCQGDEPTSDAKVDSDSPATGEFAGATR